MSLIYMQCKFNLNKNKHTIIKKFKENIIRKNKRENNSAIHYHSSSSTSTKPVLLSQPTTKDKRLLKKN